MKPHETTTTTTVEATVETTVEEITLETIHPAILLVFAEFLGYETPLTPWAETYCKGKNIEKFEKQALKVDALQTFEQMCIDYSLGELRDYFKQFKEPLLDEYMSNISELEGNDDLPF